MPAHVSDVTTNSFDEAVVQKSKTAVVVVDFWAPWCGPCRTLGPVLERAIEATGGKAVLAKVNVDEEPALSQQFGVQGIPAVVAFKDGKIVDEFVGAQPARVVEQWLSGLLPSEGELTREEADRLAREGRSGEAVAALERRLEQDESDHGAALRLARLLIDAGDIGRAVALLRAIPSGASEAGDAAGELALVELVSSGKTEPPGDAASSDARFSRAGGLWSAGSHAEALAELLELIRVDREYRDGLARRALLAALGHLDGASQIVEDARRKLAMILFS